MLRSAAAANTDGDLSEREAISTIASCLSDHDYAGTDVGLCRASTAALVRIGGGEYRGGDSRRRPEKGLTTLRVVDEGGVAGASTAARRATPAAVCPTQSRRSSRTRPTRGATA
jgi:hypothetical protein